MFRPVRIVFLTIALFAVAAGPVMASTTSSFVGVFRENFGRGNAPFGVGQVTGIGAGTESFTRTSHTFDGECWLDPGTTVLSFESGDIFLFEDNRLCTPGVSGYTPGGAVSYGNPVLWTGTYTITGGTGDFLGATGSGSTRGVLAGDVIFIFYNGTITVP
jgi:hypothetical protein